LGTAAGNPGFTQIQNLVGGLGVDTFTFKTGGSLSGTVDGGGGFCNTIVGDAVPHKWLITGPDSGYITTILPNGFVRIGQLVGGSGADTFQFTPGGSLSCGIVGGGSGGGVLVGPNITNYWVINGPNSGYITGLLISQGPNGSTLTMGPPLGFTTFTNIGTLVGGLGTDVFDFFGDPAAGGGMLTGTIDGGNAGPLGNYIIGNDFGDSFTVSGLNQGTLSTAGTPLVGTAAGNPGFKNIQNLTGGLADDTFTFGTGGVLNGKIDGGGQSANGNQIVGDNVNRTFTINGTDAGSISTILKGGFVNVQDLTGGTSGADTFTFTGAGLLTGVINGGLAGAAGNNTIVGNNFGDDFVLNGNDPNNPGGPNAGFIKHINLQGFINIQNLTGGTGNDTFTFQTNDGVDNSLTGNINGGLGRNTLDYSQFNLPVTTNLQTGTTTNVGGTFTLIENLVGSPQLETAVGAPNFDTLIGQDIPTGNVWKITGLNTGNVNFLKPLTAGAANTIPDLFTFSAVENLTGGAFQDVFRFSPGGSVDGTIFGGLDNAGFVDWLDYTPIAMGVTVNLSAINPNTGIAGMASFVGTNVVGVNNVLGSAGGGDTLIGNAANNVLVGRVGHNTIDGVGGMNVLITGQGFGSVKAGAIGNSIIVAGKTIFDNNVPALDAIQLFWTSGLPFGARVNGLLNGIGVPALNKTTITLAQPPGVRIGNGGGFQTPTVFNQGGFDLDFVRWTSMIVDFNKFRSSTTAVSF
jgi:hypothetical protein